MQATCAMAALCHHHPGIALTAIPIRGANFLVNLQRRQKFECDGVTCDRSDFLSVPATLSLRRSTGNTRSLSSSRLRILWFHCPRARYILVSSWLNETVPLALFRQLWGDIWSFQSCRAVVKPWDTIRPFGKYRRKQLSLESRTRQVVFKLPAISIYARFCTPANLRRVHDASGL